MARFGERKWRELQVTGKSAADAFFKASNGNRTLLKTLEYEDKASVWGLAEKHLFPLKRENAFDRLFLLRVWYFNYNDVLVS